MNSIGPRIAIAGEREYRQAMRQLSIDTKLLTSETQKMASAFASNEKSMEALRSKSAQLEAQISGYSKMVDVARQGLEKSQKNTSDYAKEVENLKGKLSAAQSALDGMKSSSNATEKEIAEQEKAVEKLSKELSEAEKNYERANTTTKQWQTSLNRNEASLKTAQKQLEANEKAIKDYGKAQIEAAKNSEEHKKAADNLKKTLDAVKIAVAAITTAIVFSGKAAMDYESAFAGVIKTVDASKEELQEISDGIREMSKEIPVAATDLAAIAENAGQLGIQTDNILSFTRTIADLGAATNLAGEEAAQTLAKFANITQMPQEQFSNLGSTIVALGNSFATTEKDIAAMSMRLAGAGKQAGMTESDILAMATALSSVGIEAEAGGSAFSKVFTNMNVAVQTNAESLKDYARVAGMTVEQFKSTFQSNAAEAVIKFVEGLGKAGKESVVVLEQMGLTEVRMRDALLRSASAGDTMRRAIETANVAWRENTALTKEAQQRYETTASQLQILKNNIIDAAIQIGEGLLPQIKDLSQRIKDADLQPIISAFKWIIDNSNVLLSVIAGIGAGMAAWNVSQTIYSVVQAIKVWKGAMDAAKVSQLGLNAAMAANPIGLVVTVLATLTAGLLSYKLMAGQATTAAEEFHKEVKALGEEIDTLKEKADDLSTSFEVQADEAKSLTDELYDLEAQLQSGTLTEEEAERAKNRMYDIMRQLRNIVPELVIELDTETNTLSQQKGTVEELIDAYIRLAKAKAAQNLLEQAEERRLEILAKQRTAQIGSESAQYNVNYFRKMIEETPFLGRHPDEDKYGDPLEHLRQATADLENYKKSIESLGNQYRQAEAEADALKQIIKESGVDFSAATQETQKLEQQLNNTGSAGVGAGRSISSGARTASKATKEASREIEDEFNKRLKNLKFNLDMGRITEQKYYEELELLRDTYFAEGTEEWQRYTLEIYNYQKKTFENVKKDIESLIGEISGKMESELDEVARLQANFANKIRSYTPLFSTQTITIRNWDKGQPLRIENTSLSDFRATLQKFARYTELLNRVKDRGISRAMFNEIMNLSLDDAIKFMELLLNTPEEEYQAYIMSYNAVQAVAKSLPDYIYRDEIQTIADKYTEIFKNVFQGLEGEYFGVGSMYAQAMGEGFMSQFANVFTAIKADVENKMKSLQEGINFQRYSAPQAVGNSPINITSNVNVTGGSPNTAVSRAIERTFKVLGLKGVFK